MGGCGPSSGVLDRPEYRRGPARVRQRVCAGMEGEGREWARGRPPPGRDEDRRGWGTSVGMARFVRSNGPGALSAPSQSASTKRLVRNVGSPKWVTENREVRSNQKTYGIYSFYFRAAWSHRSRYSPLPA
jgi:hypothetical protein